VNRHTRDDAVALAVQDPRSNSTRPTGTVTRSAAARVIAHRVERELFGFTVFG
jgi:hypothetical protein